jgi:TPP-dependent pyruvate/acetoin dehydrogenase alpha subunit
VPVVDELSSIEARLQGQIDAAAEYALAAPEPELSELTTDVYAGK